MAIAQTVTNAFKTGLMNGSFNFATDTFYIALYTSLATLNENTTEYTSNNEVVAAGYAPQPVTVSSTPTNQNNITYVTFNNVSWTSALTARGALIYKTGSNGAVCVLDFGSDKTSTATFTVQMPANTSTSALIRIV
jgi:hypothetical protein